MCIMLYKWQEQAVSNRRVVVRASRRAGKTRAALSWAKAAGNRVLYVVPYQTMVSLAFEEFILKEGASIQEARKNPYQLILDDGTHIDFTSQTSQLRGTRYDAVVIDDAQYINENSFIEALATAAGQIDFPFFVTHSGALPGSIRKRLEKIEEIVAVEHVQVDFLDLIEQGVYSAKDMRAIHEVVTKKSIEDEYGPWGPHEKKPRNSFFKHLLDKERA